MRRNFLVLLVALFFSLPVLAQQMPLIPQDPKVKVGKLDNGLTYYIRSNSEPKGQAEFYIVQRVGSILEMENQRGLAHFLEHMAFNGLKNFPGKKMINWLESNGVKFGQNLNAYTSFDETVYNISSVPIKRETILDSCLLILHDWSNFITLDNKEIDDERGVIREEWRTRSSAGLRMFEKSAETIFAGSQYANRMPIGLMDVVNNFKYQELKDYYHKWYRPDLQAIVVVGDFDADKVEAKVKAMFSDIPKPVNAAERTIYKVNDNEEPIVAINTDAEATNTRATVYFKHDQMPSELRGTMANLATDFINNAIESMLNNRYSEISQKPNSPFTYAMGGYGKFIISNTKDALSLIALCKEGTSATALQALLREAERVRKFGFTASEYDRFKAEMMMQMENLVKEKDKQKNDYYVSQYVQNFLQGDPIPSIEDEYALVQQAAKAITIDQVNKYASQLVTDKNIVVDITGPAKAGVAYPTVAEVKDIIKGSRSENLTAYVDKVSNEPLIAKQPVAGKVVKEVADSKFGTTVWTLSNGAKVIIKKTDFKADQVLMSATSKGGSSLFDDKDYLNFKVINDVSGLGGYGKFSKVELSKATAGKNAYVQPSISTASASLSGQYAPKDAETFMQLLYIAVTAPRMDNEAYEAYVTRTKAMLANVKAQPMVAFNDTLTGLIYNNNIRAKRLEAGDLDKVSYQRVLELYHQLFSNAGNFVFTFVGNVDPATLKPLVEKYIASLPTTKKKTDARNVGLVTQGGIHTKMFDKEMKTTKATSCIVYSGKMKYTLENSVRISLLKYLLDNIYTEKIREEEGGTYGVNVMQQVSDYPYGNFMLLINYDTDPKLVDKLQAKIKEELANVVKNGVKEENLNKMKEFMLKNYTENLKENRYWSGNLGTYYSYGHDFITGYDKVVKAVTIENIKEMAKYILDQNNKIEVVMKGFEKK